MQRSQNIGAVLMAAPAVVMLVFTIGVLRRSYLAIALPVLAAVGAVSALLIWIGYTMVNMDAELAELDMEEEAEPEPAGV